MLIRDGANLVQSADDVLELIHHFDDRAESAIRSDEIPSNCKFSDIGKSDLADVHGADRTSLLPLLSVTPVAVDELVRQSGMSPSLVQLALLELELAGRLARHAGARVSLSS